MDKSLVLCLSSAGGSSTACREGRFTWFQVAWNELWDTVDPWVPRTGHDNATGSLGLLLCETRSKESRPNGGWVRPACKMWEWFGSVPGTELTDNNRPQLGKLGMKLNSRALATALPVGYLPVLRNALVMQNGGSGGVEEGGELLLWVPYHCGGCPTCL